jgi:amino acid adenylation domain-containing protein
VAVVEPDGGSSLTWAEVLDEVRRRAERLVGAGDGVVVVEAPKRLDALLDLLAAAHAGLVAVPMDAQLPAHRRQLMTESLDRMRAARDEPGPAGIHPDDPVLVYFTSGSTGRPKAVPLTHRGLCAFARGIVPAHGLTVDDRILMAASPDNDFFLEEVVMTLAARATAVILPDGVDLTDREFSAWLERHGVTVLDLPTARWRVLAAALRETGQSLPAVVRRVIVGGEALRPADLDAWREGRCGRAVLCNAYGPTETTIVTTVFDVPDSYRDEMPPSIPIGVPLAGVEIAVVADGRPVGPGEVGELLIGGDIVALGYWGQPGLTAERFGPDAVSGRPGRRVYRTGDLVRRNDRGDLVFVGRVDDQIKIRGYRVEPGEVERVLDACPGVDEVAVVARPDPAGETCLVAFFAGPAEPAAVTAWAEERLPAWMCPRRVLPRDALPHTSTGKIDRGSLVVTWDVPPEATAPTEPAEAAGTPTEAIVADVWRRVLNLTEVGPRDNFFTIGGHSLKAMQAVVQLRRAVDTDVLLADFFRAPVLADLASLLDGRPRKGAPDA